MNLSKSKYCSGVQCPKMLWMNKNKRDEFDDSVIAEAVLAQGNEVGDLAMGLFGDYVEVPYDGDNLSNMIVDTNRLIDAGEKIICEASFSYNGLFCSVDILKNLGDKRVEIYEVKSSTDVHDPYQHDVAYQNYVLKNLGFDVVGVFLVHIDISYVRHGELELDKLFKIVDMKGEADALYYNVEMTINEIDKVMSSKDEPRLEIGARCFAPYECGFWHYCSAYLPQPNVFDLHGVQMRTKLKCLGLGKVSYNDLLETKKLVNDKALQVIRHDLEDLPDEIDREKVREFMNTLSYPIYFLDFETFNPAVPRYDDSRPYMQICFQYSLHYVEKEGDKPKHKEFLAYPGSDPRRTLCEQLCRDIPKDVCTVAYNMGFEKGRIKEMAEIFPDLSEHLMNIYDNMKDLMVPFQSRAYYNRAMQGSYSIKYVLPALFPDDPELDYHNLEGVHNGGEAMEMFMRMEKMSPSELEENRTYLLKYCELDTFALVKIWGKLKDI